MQNRNIVTNVVIFEDSTPFLTVLYCEADLQPDTTYAVSFLGTDGNKIYFNENLFQSYVTKTITSERQSVILTTKSNISKNNVNQYRNGYGWNFIKNNNNNTVIPSFSEFQIEPGSTTHDFEPHAEQNAPLSLGNEELYDGDEIEIDFVQKAGYKKVTGARFVKNMGKVVLDGSETSWYQAITNTDKVRFEYRNINFSNTTANSQTGVLLCNYFKAMSTNLTYLANVGISYRNQNDIGGIYIFDGVHDTLEDFKTWLSNHNLEVAYKLATPVTTEITDPTLLAQLEAWINLKTYKEITNIESTGTDLAPVIEFDYYQDISTLRTELATINARLDLLEE